MPVQALKPQWYLVLDDSDASIRLSSGSCLAVDDSGEVSFSTEEATHAVVFDLADDGLWMTPLLGRAVVDNVDVDATTPVAHNSVLHLGPASFRITNDLTLDGVQVVPLPSLDATQFVRPTPEVAPDLNRLPESTQVVLTQSANDSLLRQAPETAPSTPIWQSSWLAHGRLLVVQNKIPALMVGILMCLAALWLATNELGQGRPQVTETPVIAESQVRLPLLTEDAETTRPFQPVADTPVVTPTPEVPVSQPVASAVTAQPTNAASEFSVPSQVEPGTAATDSYIRIESVGPVLDVRETLESARRALRNGDAQTALQHLDTVIRLQPEHESAKRLRQQLQYILAEVPEL